MSIETMYKCKACGHLYMEPVTRCDCMPETNEFDEWVCVPKDRFSGDLEAWKDPSETTTLRDLFAAKAMQGMYAADTNECAMTLAAKVREAYECADAMLKEREK